MDVQMPVILTAGFLFLLMFFIGVFGSRYKVPEVIVYILLGMVLASFIGESELLYLVGEIGIILLFFMLGMEFPLKQLMNVAKKVTPAGTLDVILNIGITMGIVLLFGLGLIEALLIGGVVYATSSSITAKMLETSKRMANPESEFILGLLIFEDLVAPVLVAILVGLTAGTALTAGAFSIIAFKVILLIAGAVILGQVLFKKLEKFFDKYLNYDAFILFVAGTALAYGGIALYLNLSEVLGAFLAGIMIAEVRKTEQLEHLIVPVRDLTLPIFFIWFGTTIEFGEGIPMPGLLITLIVWGIVAKLIVGVVGGRIYGLSKKVSLRAAFSLVQRGEFSIIIAALASAELMVFSSVIILSTAITGIILFQFAPKISSAFYPNKKPSKVKLPG
ncbi:cation:proton antiporter [Salipaludibacillus aurantiacus]|uniref:Monovalent cation:H+ antiporter-2, CPA2 family n=1 Tax=Salipaludibacillus aurantiacus TaxID=1601833 RepID=A0A1H9RV50_9BACI|nr:cation:proton antiporter [Salipaludibacillus aurantiacus]SER76013.1 monovalent cation:H+ antiporter-2, CPA2 family [Salipaludibacillus aurantiacus]